MLIYKDILIFIIGIFVIVKSADFFTEGAEGIASAFKIPRVVIGLTVVSFATTAPEFTVSVVSSYMKAGGMAVGNALGSCIANIGLILAVAAVIRPINFELKIFKRELPFLISLVFILYFLSLDGNLSLLDGVFLIFMLIIFFTGIILSELREKNKSGQERNVNYSLKKDSLRFFIGALGVILSAKFAIIPSGISIARFLGMPEIVIGLTMVAVGTSLPELFTAVVASFKKMGELAIGNVIGANILNILWVLGFSSVVRPLEIDIQTKSITLPVVFITTLLMFIVSKTQLKLSRAEGSALFIIYISYIFYIFTFAYI